MYYLLAGKSVGHDSEIPIKIEIERLNVTSEAKELLHLLTHANPVNRYSATEALHHHWITGDCHGDEHGEHLESHECIIKSNVIDRKLNLYDQSTYKEEDIPIVHAEISLELTSETDKTKALDLLLGEVNDDQLLAEIARRRIDVHKQITEEMVRESYTFGKKLGEGASGEVFLVTHKTNEKEYACKTVTKNGE